MDLRGKNKSKDTVLGMMLSELAAPNIVRIMKTAGFEFIIVDCEHGYFDYSQLAAITAVGKTAGLPILVRVPSVSREYITKVLDMGAAGLLVPMVNTPEAAMQVVKYAKYAPLGERGISTTRPHTEYYVDNLCAYLEKANRETIILVQLETRTAIANANEIASVVGIDAVMIGPNDLAADMGTPGNFNTEEMQRAIETVIQASDCYGKKSGMIGSDINFLHQCMEKGMSIFSCSSEVGMMLWGAKNICKMFDK